MFLTAALFLVGVAQAQSFRKTNASNPVVVKEIKAIGDSRTGEIEFELLIHCNGYLSTNDLDDGQRANVLSTWVERAVDDKGREAISYTASRIDSPNAKSAPIVKGEDTRMRLSGYSGIVVSPDVQTLRSVSFYNVSNTVTNVPIEWKTPEERVAIYPAEHYLVLGRNVYEGTHVTPFTGRMEITPTKYYDSEKYYTYSDGNYLYLSGVVGNRATGEVRLIIKMKGDWTGTVQMFDDNGDAYSDEMEKMFGVSNTGVLVETFSKILKMSPEVKSFQKIKIKNRTFKDVPIQWVDVK